LKTEEHGRLADFVTAPELRLSRRALLAGGQPISALMAQALENPDLISLAAGFVDNETLPVDVVSEVLRELNSDPQEARRALQYGTTAGLPRLRAALLSRLRHQSDSTASIDQVVITAGSNQLLHLVAETLLDPGDVVLCAAPTYFVFLGTLANVHARARSVATDEHGMIPKALEQEFRRFENRGELGRIKAIYLVPYFDNPSSITMPLDRIAAIVEAAQRWSTQTRIHVICDEAYRDLRYAGEDVPSARTVDPDGETVVVAGTFSKSFSPGIRVGWGVLPPHLVDPVLDQKGNIDFGSPNLNQYLMASVLEGGLLDPHIARLRTNYRKKLTAMLAAADEHLAPIAGVRWQRPTGGLYVWARLPEGMETSTERELFKRAVDEGVLYVPGEYCYAPEGVAVEKNTMRLSFGVQSCPRINEGIQALANAICAVGASGG